MYPNGQTPAPQPPQDPFAFITQTPNNPKKSLINPSSMKMRILIIVAFVAFLGIGAAIIFSLLGSGDKDRTASYIEISQRQTEIIRIANLAESDAKRLDTKSTAVTTRVAVTSAQSELNSIIQKRGISEKELEKQLSGKKNPKTDELLSDAKKNNRYDETFVEILDAELNNYQKQLNEISAGAKKSEFTALEAAYAQISTIRNNDK